MRALEFSSSLMIDPVSDPLFFMLLADASIPIRANKLLPSPRYYMARTYMTPNLQASPTHSSLRSCS